MEVSGGKLLAQLRRCPFTTWALVALLVDASILLFDLAYDDAYWGALILTVPIWGFMYWLPSELFFTLNDGRAIPGHWWVSVITGLTLCVLADLAIHRLRRRREPEGSPRGTAANSEGGARG